MSTVLSSAVKWGYISKNPASGAELPKLVGVKPKIALTPEEAQALMSALGPMPKTLVAIAILTGVRRGELFALRWKCFDAVKGMLSVQEAIYENVIDKPKTEKSIRIIPLPQPAIRILSEGMKRRRDDRRTISSLPVTTAGSRITSKSCAAISRRPTACSPIARRVTRFSEKVVAKTGRHARVARSVEWKPLPAVSWLTFRRTFATWADQIGMSAKQRGELMGNSADVNAMIYTQVMDHPLRLAVERVSGELFIDCSLSSRMVN